MNRNITEAAVSAEEIAGSLVTVATSTKAATETVAESQQATDDLTRRSADLRSLTARFRV